jgi:hypothetical protein
MPQFPKEIKAEASGLLLECMGAIETFSIHIEQVHERGYASFTPEKFKDAHKFEYVGDVLWFLYGIYAAKYRELLETIIRSTGNKEYLVFAHCGRGIIETTAILRYYNTKIFSIVQNAKDRDAFSDDEISRIVELLDKHSRGGRFDWEAFWLSNRKDMAVKLVAAWKNRKNQKAENSLPASNPSQINTNTAIDNWLVEEPAIVLVYEFFCELVHPNLGSNFLVMGANDSSLHVAGGTIKSVGHSLTMEGIKFLVPVIKEAAKNMATLLCWAATTKRRET